MEISLTSLAMSSSINLFLFDTFYAIQLKTFFYVFSFLINFIFFFQTDFIWCEFFMDIYNWVMRKVISIRNFRSFWQNLCRSKAYWPEILRRIPLLKKYLMNNSQLRFLVIKTKKNKSAQYIHCASVNVCCPWHNWVFV